MISKIDYERQCRKAASEAKKNMRLPTEMELPELDHIVSINFGYQNGLPWQVISRPDNLQYIPRDENRRKSDDLTEEGKSLLENWYKQGLISTHIGKQTVLDSHKNYDLTPILETLKTQRQTGAMIPFSVAMSFQPVWCQREVQYRWEKTKNAMGHVPLPTHAQMTVFVYPDNSIERADANTRSYIFSNNLQFPDYEVPKEFFCIFINVQDKFEAEQIYHSIDSTMTAETFADKLSGYLRHIYGGTIKLPKKWWKGEGVYDIAVVALENYIPPGENQPATIPRTKNDAEKASVTAEKLNYFIEELVTIGSYISRDNIPRTLNAPLIGTLCRFLIKSKDNKTVLGIKSIIYHIIERGYSPWSRVNLDGVPEFKNLLIMLDELQTTADIRESINPHVNGLRTSSRRIIPDLPTKTTTNEYDRRIVCGWISYCMDKFLNGEVMDEDIIFDVTGERITDKTEHATFDKITKIAQSKLMSHHDNFWK